MVLYGLKQAHHAQFDRFGTFLLKFKFFCSPIDPSLVIFHSNYNTLIFFFYIDDIIFIRSSIILVTNFIYLLCSKFAMKYLGPIH